MSASYKISVTVEKLKTKIEANKVKKILDGYFSDVEIYPVEKLFYISVNSDNYNGGWDIESTANDIAIEIWKSLKRFVPISFSAACLENLPWENFEYDRERYRDLK